VGHGFFELLTILGFVDGFGFGADQFNGFASVLTKVLVQNPMPPKIQGAIERSLPTHGGKNGVRLFFGNDFFNGLPCDGFNVSDIGRRRIGHDRRRIAVDQDDFEALFSQSLARLNPRVIELASLTYDDRPCANQQNAFDV